jgi:lipoprotein-anchoring transpeptidase ErfK/SrfK
MLLERRGTGNVKAKDFDELRQPSRKPWLLILLIILLAVVVVQRCRRRPAPEQEENVLAPESAGQVESPPDDPGKRSEGTDRKESVDRKPLDRSVTVESALKQEQAGNLVRARNMYLQLLGAGKSASEKDRIERRLGRVNIELVMTPRPMPEKVEYVVKSGDRLSKIAQQFGTTVQLIQKSNNIENANLIKPGDRLRILQGSFRIKVSKSDNELLLKLNSEFFKRYPVGTGKFGRTPEGTFRITEKIPKPPWYRPDGKLIPYGDEENILGTRWMTLRATGDTADARGYGIHGTWDNSSIGKSESAGCIRMKNSDVEELFILVPRGTEVAIRREAAE